MNKLEKNSWASKIYFFFFKNLRWKHILPIIILGMVDMFVFLGPLYLRNVFPNPQTFFGITKSDFDLVTSIWGYVAVLFYFPSGWLADKFSNKKLVMISTGLTAALVIWWTILAKTINGEQNSYAMAQLGVIYAFWGLSTTLTFWAPLWRLLSQQVDHKDQGTAYGLQGTFNGIFGFLFVTLLGYYLLEYNASFRLDYGFEIFGYSIAAILVIGTVLVWFFALEKPAKINLESKFSGRKLLVILKSGRIWLAALMVNGIYFMQHELAYLIPYLKNIVGVSGLIAVLIGGGRTYATRIIVSQPVGRIGDRAKSFILMLAIGLTIALLLATVVLILPLLGGQNFLLDHNVAKEWINPETGQNVYVLNTQSLGAWVIFVQVTICFVIVILGGLTWFLVTLRFAQVAELPTPPNSYGTVIGFISLIAFSSNGWFNTLTSVIEKNNPMYIGELNAQGTELNPDSVTEVVNQTGSIIIISILIGVAAAGVTAGWILYIWTKIDNRNKNRVQFDRKVNNA